MMETNNHVPIGKVSSIGKSFSQDLRNIKYIGRFGTLENEMGESISKAEILKRLKETYENLSLEGKDKTSFRTIISLPLSGTEQAREIVLKEYRQRYGSFFCAFHGTNDKGESQPHLHITVINDKEKHPLRGWNEIHSVRSVIGEKFKQESISFSEKKTPEITKSQAVIHIQSRREIEEEMRGKIEAAISVAPSYEEFVSQLQTQGLNISARGDENTGLLTIETATGFRARLMRIAGASLKTKADVMSAIEEKEKQTMDEKAKTREPQRDEEAVRIWSENYARQYACFAYLNAENFSAQTAIEHKTSQDVLLDKKFMTPDMIEDVEARAAKQGIDLKRAAAQGLSSLSPAALNDLSDGNPLPLIKAISGLVCTAMQAAQKLQETRKAPKTLSPGLSFAEARARLFGKDKDKDEDPTPGQGMRPGGR